MERAYQLLHSLSANEKDLFRYSLSYVPKNNKGRSTKLLKLADFLLSSKKAPSIHQCLNEVYGIGAEGKKIINLKARLYRRLLDFFISESQLELNDELDDQDYDWIITKKKLAQFYTLFYTGKPQLALQLLNEAFEISKQNEHYYVMIECLRFKKWIIGLEKGRDVFNSIQREIARYQNGAILVSDAVDAMCELGIGSVFTVKPDTHLLERALNLVKELRVKNKNVESQVVEYYIQVLEIYILMTNNDHVKAEQKCIELEKFIKSHRSVYRKQRIASVFCDLSRCELFLGNFIRANKLAGLALEHFPKGGLNYSVAKEHEFYARFYSGDYKSARLSLNDLFGCSENHGSFRQSKYILFQACLHFKEREFRKALNILSSYLELSKDRTGWDMGIKILKAMCLIELRLNDEACRLI